MILWNKGMKDTQIEEVIIKNITIISKEKSISQNTCDIQLSQLSAIE